MEVRENRKVGEFMDERKVNVVYIRIYEISYLTKKKILLLGPVSDFKKFESKEGIFEL